MEMVDAEIEIRFKDIIDLCDQIERDLEFGTEVDLKDLNEMIISYFPPSDTNKYFNENEVEEVAARMKRIEKLLEIQRDTELERNLEQIESLQKYRKYIDVLDMVEEKKWK
jgi:hypothetical protein